MRGPLRAYISIPIMAADSAAATIRLLWVASESTWGVVAHSCHLPSGISAVLVYTAR
jgi:hypothetical protein